MPYRNWIFVICVVFVSCNFLFDDKFDEDDFAEELSVSLKPFTDTAKKIPTASEQLRMAYQFSDYNPLWIDEHGATKLAEKLLVDLDSLQWDGLDTTKYQIAALHSQLDALKKAKNISIQVAVSLDTSLTAAYIKASHDLLFGVIRPKHADSEWFHPNDPNWRLTKQMQELAAGHYPSLNLFRCRLKTYAVLRQALMQDSLQQHRDVLSVNLERLRWLPQHFEEEYVLVNIPLMELFLRRGNTDLMHMRVIVGRPSRHTPSIGADISEVVFNPPWGVPPTILKKDVLPGVEQSGEAYLEQKDLQVFDHKGNRVDGSLVNASNYKQFVFRQPPGDDNALGFIKFNMPNKWNIYLHDTPHRELFDDTARAKSSGCVRVQQPRELAEYLLADKNGKPFDQAKIDSITKTERTSIQKLNNKIPVHLVYLTAFEDASGNGVKYLKDIYEKDAAILNLLR